MPVINVKPHGALGAYSPYGGALEFMQCKDHQVFLFGSAGCGKTTAACWKMLLLCLMYPGCKFLFTRKSYRSLVKSGVETFERVVREAGLEIGKGGNKIRKLGEQEPREYVFPFAKRTHADGTVYEGNSRIVLASLDRVYDEMGAEYDYVYVNQPEQISEEDWQFLATRANGRRGKSPYPQLFGDPNPEHLQHWIKRGGYEVINGEKVGDGSRWRLIKSTYKDNPVIWDQSLQKFTKSGEEQIGRLRGSLNSVMATRLIEGEWCSSEGIVYGDVWNRDVHLKSLSEIDRLYQIDDSWPRYWAIDFGLRDPFVCSFIAKHPDRELYIRYKLIYMSGRTTPENAESIKAHTLGEPRPQLVVADRNPNEISILSQELGINIVSAKKGPGSIKARIDVLTDMLKNEQLLFAMDATVEDDKRLIELKKPIGFPEEVESLRWNDKKKTTTEEPIDGDDHEENALGYLFLHLKANSRATKFVWI